MENLKEIKRILDKYSADDAKAFSDTIEMLYKKGIPNGCYQDYSMLMDVVSILAICELIIKGE
jgi:hypothetical protein